MIGLGCRKKTELSKAAMPNGQCPVASGQREEEEIKVTAKPWDVRDGM